MCGMSMTWTDVYICDPDLLMSSENSNSSLGEHDTNKWNHIVFHVFELIQVLEFAHKPSDVETYETDVGIWVSI